MKKSYLKLISSLIVSLLVITGCQKQINEPPSSLPESTDAEQQARSRNDHGENNCRLVTLDWPTVGKWQLRYNRKGLADQWTIDYGSGSPLHTNAMTYDRNNRLVKSIENYFGSVYEYRFYYSHDRLTRVTRINVDIPEDATDFRYTYNRKGQNIRQDDDTHDQHVFMYYDALGNCTKTDIYLGTDLWYSDNYTFNASVKNPRSNIPGVETGFPFYGTGGLSDKRWFTSNRTVIYEADGTPFVYNDYDPSRTVIRTNNSNLPTSARYYDRVSESSLTITLDYDNCGRGGGHGHDGGGHHENDRTTTSSPDNIRNQVDRILHSRGINKKAQVEELRKQIKNIKNSGTHN
jgi:hypothetical protein